VFRGEQAEVHQHELEHESVRAAAGLGGGGGGAHQLAVRRAAGLRAGEPAGVVSVIQKFREGECAGDAAEEAAAGEVATRTALIKDNITERVNVQALQLSDSVEKTVVLQTKKQIDFLLNLSKQVLEDLSNIQHQLFAKVL